MATKYRFATQVIHSGQTPQSWEGATLPPTKFFGHRKQTQKFQIFCL